jgi:hypothetical protein
MYIERKRQQMGGPAMPDRQQLSSAAAVGGPTTGGVAPGAPASAPSANREPGGSWAGVRSYLDANREQGKAMADKVRVSVQQDVSAAQNARSEAEKAWLNKAGHKIAQYDATGHQMRVGDNREWQAANHFSWDASGADKAQARLNALNDMAGRGQAVRDVYGRGAGGALDAALLGQAAPGLGQQFGGVLGALREQAAPQLGAPEFVATPIPDTTPTWQDDIKKRVGKGWGH